MIFVWLVRIFFILLSGFLGYIFANSLFPGIMGKILGTVIGALLALAVILVIHFERKVIKKVDLRGNVWKKILDTSVIIDGRIAEIAQSGFIEGTFIVPKFILRELQYVADSPDPLRRAKGRRGLDTLAQLQQSRLIIIEIDDTDYPELREVDAKLVRLANAMGAKIITNDFNLNKVAMLHGVPVLNLNELANALRPIFLPGEELSIYLIKKGTGQNQGVGYLDDGTMVVVDEGANKLGKTVEVVVMSTIQTSAGRMVFGKIKTKPQELKREI